MASDLRTFIAQELKLHPRVAYQGFVTDEVRAKITSALPPLTPFKDEYSGAVCVVDWDHRLPSKTLALRVFAYYTDDALEAGNEAFDDRLEEIGRRDRFPEFDVPDFDHLVADEAYEIELTLEGDIGRCRLTSAWRREIDPEQSRQAVELARGCEDFERLCESRPDRPSHLGELEAVSWTPPCESEHEVWTLDVWYLLAFDGRIGTGRSFLVSVDTKRVVAVRDFSVRTG